MHELGIAQSIVDMAAEAADGRRVSRVTLEIGKLSGVEPRALAFCFDLVAQGSALDGAALDIREIEGRCLCRDCGAEFESPTLLTTCICGSRDAEWLAGRELNVKTMELEEAA